MNKISSRQAAFLVMSSIFSPAVRLFSVFYSENTNQSVWLAVPLAGAVFLLLALTVDSLLKENRSFPSLLEYCFGKKGKLIFSAVYFIWGTALTALLLRYYSQRLTSSAYKNTEMGIFAVIMAVMCVYALSNGISTVARMNEIILPIMISVCGLLLALLSPNVDVQSLLPVYGTKGIFDAFLFIMASFGYITFVLFFSDMINDKKSFRKYSISIVAAGVALTAWLFISVIGNLGPYVTKKLPYPFFSAVKQISIGDFLQHIEAFTVTVWILSDFIIISLVGEATLRLIPSADKKPKKTGWIVLYFALCVAVAFLGGKTNIELEKLSQYVFLPANILLLAVLPFVMLVCVKLKKRRQRLT